MPKSCDFCSKRIGLFTPQSHEALKDGLCLCNKCYTSLWEKQANSAFQAKNLARLALSGGLRPEIKSIVVKRVKEIVSSETKKLDSIFDSIDTSEITISNESPAVEVDSFEPNDIQEVPQDKPDDSKEQETEGEPIIISYEKLCEIDKELYSQVKFLWKTLGHSDLESVSIEEKSLYEQIKDLDENERSCHLLLDAEIDAFMYFRKLLNRSNGIKEMLMLPLSMTETRDSGKVFLFKPEEIIALVHYQHESINFIQAVKKDATILNLNYKESGASDFDKFVRDMIFRSVQVQVFTENILELLGVTVTEQDEYGRITNIRYNE